MSTMSCGNMTYEYMRGNGTGEATVENFYTYDALHRVTNAKENYGNASRTYQYDSLGRTSPGRPTPITSPRTTSSII